MIKIVTDISDRWDSLSVALRRIASLFVDGLIFAFFLGQSSQVEPGVHSFLNLLVLSLVVLFYFCVPHASLGKLIFQFKVISGRKFFTVFRNIQISVVFIMLSGLILLGEFPVDSDQPSNGFQNLAVFFLIFCIVDKFPVVFGGKKTIVDFFLGTMAVPKELLEAVQAELDHEDLRN